MTYVDFIVIAIVLVSSVLSVIRGFVKEAISLATWVLAAWVSITFSGRLATLLPQDLEIQSLRLAIGFIALFLLALLVGGLVNFLLSSFVTRSGLSGTDRALGVVFGLLRGVVVVAVLVLLAGLTALPQDDAWKESMLIGHFEIVAVWVRSFLPADIAGNFVFSP